MGCKFDIYNFGPKFHFHILIGGGGVCSKTNFWDERGYLIFWQMVYGRALHPHISVFNLLC